MPKFNKKKDKTASKENNKKGRLIIRNLPFSTTEDSLKKHLVKYGEISEVKLLRKADGKLVGCGFVQFTQKQKAAKAIHHASGKEFLGRTIIIDWAVPKNKFVPANQVATDAQTNEESDSESDAEVKIESDENGDSDDSEDSEDDIDDNENESDEHDVKESYDKTRPEPSHDIPEGKTVFLKEVSFSVNNEELKEFMEQFGRVLFAAICMDPLTEHSRGTAFVKFKDIDGAENCLNATPDQLKLKGQIMKPFKALHRNDLARKEKEKRFEKKKDNRNLYLVKEGVVTAGGPAAIGVSQNDMEKRLELEMWKSNILRNLNMFVSKTRLIVHNLPPTYDDQQLKALFKKYSPSSRSLREVKIMRNMKSADAEGKPVSRGYGFVSFGEHEEALKALRAINNNPNIFNKAKRPIVSFSIENRAILAAKQKRLEKSKLNNPTCPDWKKPKVDYKSENPKMNNKTTFNNNQTRVNKGENEYEGMSAKPGSMKFRSKQKINTQRNTHFQNIKDMKREEKRKRKMMEMRKEQKREPKIKSKIPKMEKIKEKEFVNLVDKYKQNMLSQNHNFKKWYET